MGNGDTAGEPSAGDSGSSSGRAGGMTGGSDAGGSAAGGGSLLVFSRTVEYRHDSIPTGVAALSKLASERGWQLTATEDPGQFSDSNLSQYRAVIFLSTTGDVLDESQQAAFERFIRAGRGFVGIHSATDTEYDWSWYGALVGAYFREHPAIQAADVVVDDAASAATLGLPNPWHRTDEWYAFKSNPRADVHVLLSLDETSYAAGASTMRGDHPIAWQHEYDGGRAFYTALGHTNESYADPLFIGHVAGGISWAIGL
jgi:cytochrome c